MKKMVCNCGAPLTLTAHGRYARCDYCRTMYELDEDGSVSCRADALYSLAAEARESGRFDDSRRLLLEIISRFGEEDSYLAYWNIVLCEYHARLKYIESENCVNVQCEGCLRDIEKNVSYQKALQYGVQDTAFIDTIQRIAAKIQEFVKNTLAIRGNYPNYEIFLCYKTKDSNDQYTPEYTVAKNLYMRLRRKGYMVFFADDITGLDSNNYAPTIYYAEQKSRLFLYCCSSRENAESIWMSNELETYIDFMGRDDNNDRKMFPILCAGADSSVLPTCFDSYDPWIISNDASEGSYLAIIDKITDKLGLAGVPIPSAAAEKTQPKRSGTAVVLSVVCAAILFLSGAYLLYLYLPRMPFFAGTAASVTDTSSIGELYDVISQKHYDSGVVYMNSGHYDKAIAEFSSIPGYKDADNLLAECRYAYAEEYYNKGMYEYAAEILENYFGESVVPAFTSFEASSELPNGLSIDYIAVNAFDGELTTSWQEGVDGKGAGQWIGCSSERIQRIAEISICNGALSSAGSDYLSNSRPSKLRVTTDSGFSTVIELEDNNTSLQTYCPESPIYCREMRFTIIDAYDGTKWSDTAIAEIQFR